MDQTPHESRAETRTGPFAEGLSGLCESYVSLELLLYTLRSFSISASNTDCIVFFRHTVQYSDSSRVPA
jgi:hypothetical protein